MRGGRVRPRENVPESIDYWRRPPPPRLPRWTLGRARIPFNSIDRKVAVRHDAAQGVARSGENPRRYGVAVERVGGGCPVITYEAPISPCIARDRMGRPRYGRLTRFVRS